MQTRYIAILIALCLLVGIAAFSALLSGAIGLPAGQPVPPLKTTGVPTAGSPTPGAPEMVDMAPVVAITGTSPAPTLTPNVTPTEYIEQDSTQSPGEPAPINPGTTVPSSIPSTAAVTATSTEQPSEVETTRTPRTTEPTERVTTREPRPSAVTVRVRAQDGEFSPSTITVPAGATVTVVFENRDADVKHSVIVYAEGDENDPIFTGTVVRGPDQATDTFTAPSTPGTYTLGCGTPSAHPKGTFIVE